MDEMKTTVRTLTFSTNYVPPVPLCLEKWGVMTPPAPMGAPPLDIRTDRQTSSDSIVRAVRSIAW